MDLLTLVLAQAAENAPPAPPGGIPEWMGYVLGPLGALVLLLVYAIYTEKYRMAGYRTLLEKAKEELSSARAATQAAHDLCKQERATDRTRWEAREKELEKKIEDWRDRHTKEKAVRAWYQSQAQQLADDCDEELKPPPDIDKTHYGGDD